MVSATTVSNTIDESQVLFAALSLLVEAHLLHRSIPKSE